MKKLFFTTLFTIIAVISSGQVDNIKLQQDFVKEFNAYRVTKGLSTVKLDSTCIRLAKEQAEYCSSINNLTHDRPFKQQSLEKIPYFIFAENGQINYNSSSTSTQILNVWKSSVLHNNNLLLSDIRKIGIYSAYNSASNRYYVFLVVID